MSFYHAINAARLVQMPSKKKKMSCPFSSPTASRKKPKKSFSLDWAEKLAESDKGSYFDQEQWLKELNEQPSAECDPSVSTSISSASRSKITVEEPLADLESENTEKWQKLLGHTIVAGEKLQDKINESVTCRFCQGSVELMENLRRKTGLGSTWMFQCQNESCPSYETNRELKQRRRRRRGRRLVKKEFIFYKRNSRWSRSVQYANRTKNVLQLHMRRRR